jgi:Holliday junction resolvasome RuvABC DNA-binding subunit
MISFLHGKLIEALPSRVTVEVNGLGYEVLIPLSSYEKLPQPGQEVKLLTHLPVREDAHTLYGFVTNAERELFRLLINSVSGIGPKIALNILSGISVTAFRGAVANSDVKALSQISGVGKKTAASLPGCAGRKWHTLANKPCMRLRKPKSKPREGNGEGKAPRKQSTRCCKPERDAAIARNGGSGIYLDWVQGVGRSR